MKKTSILLSAFLAGSLMSTPLIAEEASKAETTEVAKTSKKLGGWEKTTAVGVTYVTLDEADPQFGLGLNYLFDRSFTSVPGMRLGGNIGIDVYLLDTLADANTEIGYTMDVAFMGGYSFDDKFNVPIKVMAGVGYQFGFIGEGDDNTAKGLMYKANATYNFTDGFGAGVEYKHADLEYGIGSFDLPADFMSAYITFKM